MRLTLRRCAATLAMTALVSVPLAGAHAAAGSPIDEGAQRLTFALLGDTPYDDAQRAQFPALVDAVNADPAIRLVLHAGDVKSGSTTCDDARFADLAALYDTFRDPFVLTPGDNEWTDCHRTAAGGYLPTERLEAVRRYFFPEPGRTLGRREMSVQTQADDPRISPTGRTCCSSDHGWSSPPCTSSAARTTSSRGHSYPAGTDPTCGCRSSPPAARRRWTGSTAPSTRHGSATRLACCC
jgi:hypothetical protein